MSIPVPPLDWPHYGIGFVAAVKRGFQKYATFSGRASRSEFWWWALANAIVGTVLYLLTVGLGVATASKPGQVIGPGGWAFGILLVVWALAVIIPNIAVTIRRLHDAGYSGWFYLFSVFGLGIVTLVLCAMETSPVAAKYGPPYPQGYARPRRLWSSRTRATARRPARRSSTDLPTSEPPWTSRLRRLCRSRIRSTSLVSGGPDARAAATVTAQQMGVDDADRFHQGEHRGRSDEPETLLPQGFGQGDRLRRAGRDVGVADGPGCLGRPERPDEVG